MLAAMKPMQRMLVSFAFVLPLASCGTLTYDLSDVPFPVSARPMPERDSEPFELTGKSVLYVHGLAGKDQPDVGKMLLERCAGTPGVTDFRVTVGASFHDWLLTHLSLGLVRMKTVRVTGRRITR
jgi:hypothetical protein